MDLTYILDNLSLISAFFIAPWVLLALFSAFGDALVGYVDEWMLKRLRKKKRIIVVDAPGRLLLISGFFGGVVAIGAVIASIFLGPEYTLSVPSESLLLAVMAGILEVVWLIPYFYALERGGAINTTPLFQTIPIFSLLFGLLIFNEVPDPIHIFATILIIIGASLLNYSPKTKSLDVINLLLMLGASATISLGYFLFKDATQTGNFVSSLFGNGLGMFLLSLNIWMFWPPYRKQFNDFVETMDFKVLLMQVSNETLFALSAMANQLAIVIGPSVMIVSAFNAFHPLFTLLIGFSLAKLGSIDHSKSLGEGRLAIKTAAILLIAGGTVLIVI